MSKEYIRDTDFINKLKEIVEANLANENFGAKELAEEIGISYSQIHRRIKSITNQSASQFIRELRLEKAKGMLLQEGCTVSEISYQVGFGSPSYFNKCFHDYFGFTPGEYKKHVPDKKENPEKEDLFKEVQIPKFSSQKPNKSGFRQKLRSYKKLPSVALGILVLAICFVFIFNYFKGEKENAYPIIPDKSIAVLPLKNLSRNTENNYLADGIMEDILNRLSQVQELEVKSRITSEKYMHRKMTLPEIAQEMNVSYILEGSILKLDERVRIYIQLIDAVNDRQIWSDQYDHDMSDIFDFVSDVSKQIVSNLQTTLKISEIQQINKRYTESEEAYSLYLEGRFYWQMRGEENIRKSIEYFNKALKIDSNFSLAYTGLADAYHILAWYQNDPRKEAIAKSKTYVLRALKIDNNLVEAHTIVGMNATYFQWNWELAEQEFQKGMEINPNYAPLHQEYSEYLDIIGKRDEARFHIDRAIELNPYAVVIRKLSYYYYRKEGRYDKALEESHKIFTIDNDIIAHSMRNFQVYIMQKNGLMALEEFKKIHAGQSGKFAPEALDSLYAQSGSEGIIRMILEDIHLQNEYYNIFYHIAIARYYAILGEKKIALDHLEEAYNKNISPIVRIKYDQVYINLRTEPRFLALLEKMNLGGY